MKTRITELFGIQYPIFQGGMAWVAESTLAAAVSNAGGLGIIAGGSAPGEVIREEIRKCKAQTDKPFGVNIMLMSPNTEDLARIVVEEGVPVVTTGAGNPGKYMEAWKAAGIKVVPVVPSVALAKRMERAGPTRSSPRAWSRAATSARSRRCASSHRSWTRSASRSSGPAASPTGGASRQS